MLAQLIFDSFVQRDSHTKDVVVCFFGHCACLWAIKWRSSARWPPPLFVTCLASTSGRLGSLVVAGGCLFKMCADPPLLKIGRASGSSTGGSAARNCG